ncbi:hypothetical protein MAPG_02445, partial [Magnaporthiopsis poae ATCC 64411]|uniref:Small ribosomal subunit protein mS33 n=1 Tax=Magnaporthiopsis poae (strain ATCC 64411 / 73-15) TaxID=644358 RepID=A0A0C4DRD7_MAGP6
MQRQVFNLCIAGRQLHPTTARSCHAIKMSVPRARLLELLKARCQIFATTFNPEGVRTGNKVLRQRLRGPALAAYYPRRLVTFNDIRNEFGNEFVMENEPEKERLRKVEALKLRGKGAPKKKKGPPDPKAKRR